MIPFFIISLPRTRTAWLANLFTTERTHCYHEYLVHNSLQNMEANFRSVEKEYVGNSDSLNIGVFNDLRQLFPDAPIVTVERPLMDIQQSVIKAIKDVDKNVSWEMLQMGNELLKELKKQDNVLTVQFDNLKDENTIENVWNHCIPTIPPDKQRLSLLQQLKITVKYDSFFQKGGLLWPHG